MRRLTARVLRILAVGCCLVWVDGGPGPARLAGRLRFALAGLAVAQSAEAAQQPLNIIAFGAHPDDCDQRAGGVAAKYAALGHR
ncbi:MAG: hypothetical protein ACRD09_09305, partial [Vicinamibacterales bacterium]